MVYSFNITTIDIWFASTWRIRIKMKLAAKTFILPLFCAFFEQVSLAVTLATSVI